MSPDSQKGRSATVVTVGGPVVLFGAALLLPLGWVAAHAWTLTGLYEESIGYRYFYSLRVVYGHEYAFLPQGHLIDVGYQWLQRLLTVAGHPPTELFPRIDMFAYAAVAAAHLTAVACFAWVVGSVSTPAGRLFTSVFWLAAYYGMGESGVYVLLQPDYHAWILSIGLVTAGIFSRWAELMDRWSVRHSVGLGVFLGLAAAVKATLVIFPGTVALGWMLVHRPWRRALTQGGLSGAVGVVTLFGILFVDSQGRLDRLARLLSDLMTFAEATRPAEPYVSWLSRVAVQAPVLVTLAVALPALLSVSIGLAQRRYERAAITGLIVGAALYHAMLYWRFVPATWFEAVVFLQVAAWGVVRMIAPGWLQARGTAIGALVLAAVLVMAGGRPALAYLCEIEKVHEAGRELGRVLSANAGRVAFLVPDDSLTPLSVDSAIAKGMNNILNYSVSSLVRHTFPERQYVLGAPRYLPAHYQQNPVDVSEFSTVVFVVPLTKERNRSAQIEALEDYFSVSLALFDCTRDVNFGAGTKGASRPGLSHRPAPQAQMVVVCARRARVLGRWDTGQALYVPVAAKVGPGAMVRDRWARPARLREGDFVLSGHSGQLLKIERDGRVVRLTADEHHRIEVPNVGQWDTIAGAYRGLAAEYVQGRWVIDGAALRAANTNNRFEQGDEHDPIPGFWISPKDASHRITRLRDAGGAFIRIEATGDSPYLVVNRGVLTSPAGTPVTLRGTIRAHGSGKMALTWHEVVGSGRAESSMVQADADDAWQTLVIRRDQAVHPAPGDNVSLGLIGPKKGDWFDVRELSLFVGTLP